MVLPIFNIYIINKLWYSIIVRFMTTKFTFGKYKDKLIYDVSNIDPDYIMWAYENIKNPKHGGVDKDLYEACIMDSYYDEEEYYLGVDRYGK